MKMKLALSVTLVTMFLFSAVSFAELKKGSVGSGASKKYSFVADRSGQARITLVYDSPASDLDLAAAIVTDGEATLLGADISTMKNFAQVEFGVVSGLPVYIIVSSYRGASPFRVFVTTSGEEGMQNMSIELQEENEGYRADSAKIETDIKRIQRIKKN